MPLPSLSARLNKIRVLGDKLLVRKRDDNSTAGPIILPTGMAHVDLGRATVLQVGPRVNICKPGDTILMPRQFGYQKIEYHGAIAHFIPQNAVHAVEPK